MVINIPTWLSVNGYYAFLAFVAMIAIALTVEAEMKLERTKRARSIVIIAILFVAFGPLVANWIQNSRQAQVELHWRTVALEAARRNHVKLLSDEQVDSIAAIMRRYADVPMELQCLPGTTESFCKPLERALARSVHRLGASYNVSLFSGGLDAQPIPDAPSGIMIFTQPGAQHEAANALASYLRNLAFDVASKDLNMRIGTDPTNNPVVLIRVYDP